jgi:hypothetical protein
VTLDSNRLIGTSGSSRHVTSTSMARPRAAPHFINVSRRGSLRFQPSSTCKVQNHNVSAITVGAAKTNAVHFLIRCCTRVTQWGINTDQSVAHRHCGAFVVRDFSARVTCGARVASGDLQDIVRAVRARGASFDRHQHRSLKCFLDTRRVCGRGQECGARSLLRHPSRGSGREYRDLR